MALTIEEKMEALTYKAEDEKRLIMFNEIGQYVIENIDFLSDEIVLNNYLIAKRLEKKNATIANLEAKLVELKK